MHVITEVLLVSNRPENESQKQKAQLFRVGLSEAVIA